MTTETVSSRRAVLEGVRFSRSTFAEWLALVAYAVLLIYEIPRHEPWADEAQAWQLARYVSIPQLFGHYLRYEGSPGLWHLLLAGLGKLNVTYGGLHWFSGVVALAGISLLIFLSPFPRWVRLTLPFTFYLAFQYAVVARSYVLVPLLLFGVALVWRRSPILVALLLGLLANVAMHAFAISGGFALVYLIEIWRGHRKRPDARTMLISACLLIMFYGFALWTVLPHPSDLSFYVPFEPHRRPLEKVEVWLIKSAISICIGVAEPGILAVPLWILFLVRFGFAGRVFCFLPIATFALFSGFYFNFWQAGLVIPATIAICWIAWEDVGPSMSWYGMTVGIICFIAMQLAWTVHANRAHPYSPEEETARFLAPHVAAGESIAVTYVKLDDANAFHSIGLYPYFNRPIFVNQPRPFWLWSTREHTFDQFKETMDSNPTMVMAVFYDFHLFDPSRDLAGPRMELVKKDGYRLTHTFCAEKASGFGWREEICDLIFERATNSKPE